MTDQPRYKALYEVAIGGKTLVIPVSNPALDVTIITLAVQRVIFWVDPSLQYRVRRAEPCDYDLDETDKVAATQEDVEHIIRMALKRR